MLQPHEYTISYRLHNGTHVERYYHHHVEAPFEKGLVLTPDHGWLYELVTIIHVDSHPDETQPGSARAEPYEPPPHDTENDEDVQPSTAVESL